jgi:hypothetical protein
MDIEYKKDLHHNYMVITQTAQNKTESYCIRMLSQIPIDGVIRLERRSLDNQILYYYDISAKQSMKVLLDKTALSYDRVKQLFVHVIQAIEKAYEYLLNEDDFLLMPEYIFIDVTTERPYLCYLSGYQMNIKDQMKSLIEYFMNKIDYNDKNAVLFIYSLFAVSKEEGFTFEQLLQEIKKQSHSEQAGFIKEIKDNPPNEKQAEIARKEKTQASTIPLMMEKLVDEEEVSCFPLRVYLYTVFCILGGMLIIVVSILSGIIYNSFGNHIDYTKLFALFLIITCLEGYLLKITWNKKNKVTKMIMKQEYIDPGKEFEMDNKQEGRKRSEYQINRGIENAKEIVIEKVKQNMKETVTENSAMIISAIKESENKEFVMQVEANRLQQELRSEGQEDMEDENPTCILNDSPADPNFLLEPLNSREYEKIYIRQFPFFIGKLKKNVDYCLEKAVVSRYHAKITREGDCYYLTDLNSTNGTFLNGETLQTYQKREISHGDEITFANIKYQFLII